MDMAMALTIFFIFLAVAAQVLNIIQLIVKEPLCRIVRWEAAVILFAVAAAVMY